MLGVRRSEVQSIIAGMAEAMAADDNLLLSADEWIKIAGVAAQRAASNPGRLFGLSTENRGGALAVTVIKAVLEVAGDTWTDDLNAIALWGYAGISTGGCDQGIGRECHGNCRKSQPRRTVLAEAVGQSIRKSGKIR
jgi:hypothetical protein